MKKTLIIAERIIWFLNGRLGEHLYIRRDIRKYWQFIMCAIAIFLFIRFIMFPFFGWWDKIICGMNHVIWS